MAENGKKLVRIPEWALPPWGTEPGVEVRPSFDGTIDEVCIDLGNGAFFHLEQMCAETYWMGISWRDGDGEERMQHLTITSRNGSRLFPTAYV